MGRSPLTNLLLDTHIWVRGILEPRRIKRTVARALENPEHELLLSPVSIWEVLVLARKKRWQLDPDGEAWVRRCLRERPLREAPLTREIAMQSQRLELPHADPAGRFIAATAQVLELVLVTADENLIGCKSVRTLSNR
ncbi:PilT-like protein (modular protein) [Candidatus Sulfopaludibacter sp. SbA3]|nr:PilT-like protein (modular protein) [Candidatus Sulfopaludibacter sp. SbA3]